ncbi:MAG: hypothetical protein ACREVY_15355 [Gammaproteobacteria bacterium]
MQHRSLDRALLEQFTRPEPRLPALEHWLIDDVWTEHAFQSASRSPKDYLILGERSVAERERMLGMSAESIASELAAEPPVNRSVDRFLQDNPSSAVVIFDGCSLREVPRLAELARSSSRQIIEIGCGRAAVPSETDWFVADRLGFGLPRIGPSQLTTRGELKQRGIRFYYFKQAGEHHTVEKTDRSLILWTRFPDQRYTDSTATDETLFEALWDGLELAWKRTVGAVPTDKKVLVTSDHGYIFLGAGLGDPNLEGLDRPLSGKRFRCFEPAEALPDPEPGLWVHTERRLAVLSGRTHNRPQAPSASQSIYRHGGLSLMEMLTPWLVLAPVS